METYAQRSVRHCLDMIAPFEASEPSAETGQRQFYQFMTSLYQGMYEEPEAYLVFPAPYEAHMARSKQKTSPGKKEKEHVTDARESTLRNTFQQAIQFYATYFYQLGLNSAGLEESTGALVISQEEYEGVLGRMNRFHGAEHNAGRYRVLEKLGVRIHGGEGLIHVVHEKYDRAMIGLLYLCQAPDSKYKWMNYLRLDYKNAYSPAPAVEDICRTLTEESAMLVKRLEDNLAGMKVRAKIKPLRGIVSDFKWKVEYTYKGKNICGFYADREHFMLCVYFNHYENINAFAKILFEEDRQLFLWFKEQFPERLCKCPSNRRVFFGEESRRICGLSNRAEVTDPGETDVENALRILRKYRNITG